MGSRWQQLYGRAAPSENQETRDDDSWVDAWQRHVLVDDARHRILDNNDDSDDDDVAFPWPPPLSHLDAAPEVDADVQAQAKKHIQAWLYVEESAKTIKQALHTGKPSRAKRQILQQPPPTVVRTRPVAAARHVQRHVAPAPTKVKAPTLSRSAARSTPKTGPALLAEEPTHRTRSALSVKPRAHSATKELSRQEVVASRRLAQEITRVSALQEANAQRTYARTILRKMWGAWADSALRGRAELQHATRTHRLAVLQRHLHAWRRVTQAYQRARAAAHAQARLETLRVLDHLAGQHHRAKCLFRCFVHWRAFAARSKREKAQGVGASQRRQLAATLLTAALAPEAASHRDCGTSPAFPKQNVVRRSVQLWTLQAAASPVKGQATSPLLQKKPKPKVKIQRCDAPPPAAIVDMHARMAERKARWDLLQEKYKLKQAMAAEVEAQMRAAQAAAAEEERLAAIERKRALKREAQRKEEAALQEKELRRQQLVLAKRHAARATVYWRGFLPWWHRHVYSKRQVTKALNWHHDTLLCYAFRAWTRFLLAARADRARAEDEALDDARWYYQYRRMRVLFAQWKATRMQTQRKAESIAQQHGWQLVATVWHGMHARVAARAERLQAAQRQRTRRQCAHVVATWRAFVRGSQAAAAAEKEKEAMRRQVFEWLREAG
ncbi:hypothetical protein SPRG_04032 [Saprolegnia parasitica CBS 223.65]|uniref:Sfi1 spindle body domain-containing protein n=1 Tax=Saprolegnia parasitica (strain CBS 223.65) TaxID=695850 RepID=A0A067CX87_SAPPC|nr:hypothetical protein SPRG_04032 [Saprolegnia parasitica CBS 223.65]KDO31417.1 hypothetical protein SPRG_04032 [Saprolegnia parasitica CBS 223.65]|eukprot:XP_012198012.1 hypothetical protein SPRG_04032 [Saprolegnia parasitica CBS 223.65]